MKTTAITEKNWDKVGITLIEFTATQYYLF